MTHKLGKGQNGHLVLGLGGIQSQLLRKIANKVDFDHPTKKEVKRRTGGSGIKMSDDEVRSARKAYQSGKVKCTELAKLYDVNYGYMQGLLSYKLRGNVLD